MPDVNFNGPLIEAFDSIRALEIAAMAAVTKKPITSRVFQKLTQIQELLQDVQAYVRDWERPGGELYPGA